MRSVKEIQAAIDRLNKHAFGRQFTEPERARWNDLNDELERAQEIETREARIRELADSPRHVEGPEPEPRPRRTHRDLPRHMKETRDAALHVVEEISDEIPARAADRLERLLEEDVGGPTMGLNARRVAAAGADAYNSAFGKLLANPTGAHLDWTPEEHEAMQRVNRVRAEERALGLGTQGGSYPVPVTLDPTVILNSDGAVNPLRQIARVEPITGTTWSGVASSGITASYDPEATEVGDDSPTLTQPSISVEKAQAFVPFSIEVGEDWASLQTEMAHLLRDAKDTLEAEKFLSGLGSGSNEPQGLLVGATAVVTSAATATIAVPDLYSLVEALAERWQPRASIVASRAAYNKVRQFDSSGGASLWVSLGNGLPPRLLDYGSYVYSAMTSAVTTTASSVMTIGDFSQYAIVDRVGLNIEVVPHLFGTAYNRPTGQRGLYAHWRNSAEVLTMSAFKTLKLL